MGKYKQIVVLIFLCVFTQSCQTPLPKKPTEAVIGKVDFVFRDRSRVDPSCGVVINGKYTGMLDHQGYFLIPLEVGYYELIELACLQHGFIFRDMKFSVQKGEVINIGLLKIDAGNKSKKHAGLLESAKANFNDDLRQINEIGFVKKTLEHLDFPERYLALIKPMKVKDVNLFRKRLKFTHKITSYPSRFMMISK